MTRSAAPVETVRDGLAALARQIAQLAIEVNALNKVFGSFDAKPVQYHPFIPVEWSGENNNFAESPKTPEPRKEIEAALEQTKKLKNPDIATKLIRAMAKDLDGAFRDIRATRADVAAIKDDSDSRSNFKDWVERTR